MAMESDASFAILQSRVHEVWARFFMSTLEDRLAYTPTTVFAPFPFPVTADGDDVDNAGRVYLERRSRMLLDRNEGLTDAYNRFHDPEEQGADVLEFRAIHSDMDRAVLDAYGWPDIPTDCDFVVDYEVDDDGTSHKKKPWRYRWPDDVHHEVLARLLALNAERAAGEQRSGATNTAGPTKRPAIAAGPAPQEDGLF
jgi:hypothetical protein